MTINNKQRLSMRSVLKLLGVSIMCCMAAACTGTTHKSDASGVMSVDIQPNYFDDTEAYLKEPREGEDKGVKRLIFIKHKDTPTYCRFREITYFPQDKEFNSTSAVISAGFADEFSVGLTKSTSGVKASGVAILTSMKLPIADYDTWLSALRYTIQQSDILQYFMDSHTLVIAVPGATPQSKKYVVGECRIVGYPGELAAATNELVAMYQSIKLNGGK